MATTPETEISYERKRNRGKPGARFSGGNKKNPDRSRICGLAYLVVDDGRFARATVKDVLHGIGIRNIVEMADAAEAIHYVGEHPVDVIVADFEISGMNGAEFVWRLRRSREERVRRIPVVMVSDHADEGHIRIAINAGVNEYISKPFSQKDLYARIRRSVITPKPFIIASGYIGPDRRVLDNGTRNEIERRCALSPLDLLEKPAGLETKRIEATKAAGTAASADAAAAQAQPTKKTERSYAVLSEISPLGTDADSGLARRLKEQFGTKGGVD